MGLGHILTGHFLVQKGIISSSNTYKVGLVKKGVRILKKMLHYAKSKKCTLVVQLPS